jgi:hypothetical protein
VANKWGRRAKRHQEKHREYFETVARQIIKERRATVDLGTVTLDVRLRRWKRWLEIDTGQSSAGAGVGRVTYVGGRRREELVSTIVNYLIIEVSNYPGVQIPPPA